MEKIVKAYLAGMFDGEDTISVNKRHDTVVRVACTNKEIISLFQKLCQGNIQVMDYWKKSKR